MNELVSSLSVLAATIIAGYSLWFARKDKRFEIIDNRFDQVDKQFQQIDKRFEQVDKRFEQVDKRFEQVDKQFEQIDKRFDKIEAILERIEVKFDKLQADTIAIDRRLIVLETLDKAAHRPPLQTEQHPVHRRRRNSKGQLQ